ncbi:MAG: hypothetical protein Q7S29_00420 [Candidatus Peribacter sp.]|nr:hypothetical protein [Candidatus Peribacter sp.]
MAVLDNIGRSAQSVAEVPVDFAKAGVEMLVGENPLPKMKESVKRGLWDTVALGPRIIRDTVAGLLKGTLRLTWSAIKMLPLPLPMLDSWKKERGDVMLRTKDALELFKFDSKFPPLTFAKKQETPQQLAA